MYCLQICHRSFRHDFRFDFLGLHQLIVPVTLGAIATALTDFDDRTQYSIYVTSAMSVYYFLASAVF